MREKLLCRFEARGLPAHCSNHTIERFTDRNVVIDHVHNGVSVDDIVKRGGCRDNMSRNIVEDVANMSVHSNLLHRAILILPMSGANPLPVRLLTLDRLRPT